ncbi:MAG TPA: coenzyme F420-0:L-glutamate ligase, partial [Egibacteraceae bacterium]|nr:coenzyme F420-0:L-glutamate ligase [Egibacteraceae bacterium]
MTLTVIPVTGLPEVRHGDDLPALIAGAADLQDGDVVVVSQKVVSKVEGAVVSLQAGEGAAEARRRLAREQATEVVADSPWVLIVRTRHGLVCANAGIDASNVEPGLLTLLPDDPDRSARLIRDGLRAAAGVDVAVIVSDTFGRPWRNGQTDVAIGVAGLVPVRDERGAADRFGTTLDVTEAAVADELAGAADLVRTKA